MKPSDETAFRRKLDDDLKTVFQGVAALFSQRRVFEKIVRVFAENEVLSADWTELHTFLSGGYVAQACMRLRRVMDRANDKDSVSLANIVDRLCQHSALFTREDYVARFEQGQDLPFVREHREDEANQLFDRFGGPGGCCLDAGRVQSLFTAVEAKCRTVLTYVDKRLAHHDREAPEQATLDELSEAIDAVGDLYIGIRLLLTGSAPKRDELACTWQGASWESLLEVPWGPSGVSY